mgnify:CR=1 FL=1
MSHYYTKTNDQLDSLKRNVQFKIHDHLFQMTTDKGVFSKSGLDFGTRVLLETISIQPHETVLDLGCGYGAMGLVINSLFRSSVTLVDINQRAVQLTKENAEKLKLNVTVFQSDGFSNVNGTFDVIVTNPPIRAGKAVIYRWFESAKTYLNDNGRLILVINQNQGAPSAITFLKEQYQTVDILDKKSGFYVISCQK